MRATVMLEFFSIPEPEPPPPPPADTAEAGIAAGEDERAGSRAGSVLLVEDDRNIQRSLSYQLQRQGYKVTSHFDGESGLEEALRNRFTVVVLDVMLPRLDGLSLCKQLRAARRDQAIILISARGSDLDKITGLEFGADDYLAKPFSPAELEARIRALRRRTAAEAASELIEVGGVTLDPERYQLKVGEVIVRLTPKEMGLLKILMGSPGRVFPREYLLAQAWGFSYDGYHRAVDAHINRLKVKLYDQLGEPADWLEAIYGVGYRVRDPNQEG
ncbi:MAG TPA: response regulator transcription factor [Terriglobales bacterium]|nr:response regulator transcription factor [Terriglobales bacterium]